MSGTDKQQHLDGKFDGEFSPKKRLSFANQLHEKLVHNRVGVSVGLVSPAEISVINLRK
jgi:hypothetical protein